MPGFEWINKLEEQAVKKVFSKVGYLWPTDLIK